MKPRDPFALLPSEISRDMLDAFELEELQACRNIRARHHGLPHIQEGLKAGRLVHGHHLKSGLACVRRAHKRLAFRRPTRNARGQPGPNFVVLRRGATVVRLPFD